MVKILANGIHILETEIYLLGNILLHMNMHLKSLGSSYELVSSWWETSSLLGQESPNNEWKYGWTWRPCLDKTLDEGIQFSLNLYYPERQQRRSGYPGR